MNERIRELEKQSYTEVMHEMGGTYMAFDKEKFAELIVKKCMDVAKYHTPDTEECEYTWLIHDKIKKYFGVKE